MNWILDHLQLVIAAAGAFAFWLKQRSGSKEKTATLARPKQPATMADGDNADRARKIREEILRKIAERRGGTPTPAGQTKQERAKKFELPPVIRSIPSLDSFGGPGRTAQRRSRETVPPLPVGAKTESDEAVLARQERLAQQLRDLEAQRATAARRATVVTEAARVAEDVSARAASNVRRQLRDPQSVRHAVILREVLGTPVGLR